MREFASTKEIEVPKRLIDQIIGQDNAVEIVKTAAAQKRNVLLIGPPGTGKSMLAQAMAELMPAEKLEDVLVYPNPANDNNPKIMVVKTYPAWKDISENKDYEKYYMLEEIEEIKRTPSGDKKRVPDILKLGLGRRISTERNGIDAAAKTLPPNFIIALIGIILIAVVFLTELEANVKGLVVLMALGLGFLIIVSSATAGLGRRFAPFESAVPKLIVDNTGKTTAPFIDATGSKAGALLGDVKHDPLQCFFPTTTVLKNNGSDLIPVILSELVGELIERYHDRIERNDEDYEGIVLPEEEAVYVLGYKDGKTLPVRVHCVNRRRYNGKMRIVHSNLIPPRTSERMQHEPRHVQREDAAQVATLSSNKYENKLIVTPEHKIYVDGRYIEAEKLNGNEKLTILEWKKPANTEHICIPNGRHIEFSGMIYNITTESGNLFANGILASNSGGLGTPPHLRVEAGAVHHANKGVLFIDEIASLKLNWQQELLTAMQEKKYRITGQSEMSSGALVKTHAVPSDFVLVAAGNLPDMQQIHPALRSRIRGAGYEIYVEDTMEDNKANQDRLVQFVAQEAVKDGKIPHFTKEAVLELIEEARRYSGRRKKLTLNLRELGGLLRAAGDIALEKKHRLVEREDVINAKKVFRPIESQLGKKIIEQKKEYQTIISEGSAIGRVNGLAVLGDSHAGLVLPIVADVTPSASKSEGHVIATGKLGTIAKEAVDNVSAIIKKHIGTDVSKKDIHIQFMQTYEGVEGDSASISTAVAVLSAMSGIPVRQEVGMTGSLDVRGGVLPVGGVSAKLEAAIDSGLKKVLIPKTNADDVYLTPERRKRIEIIGVSNIADVLKYALEDGKEKDSLLKKMNNQIG